MYVPISNNSLNLPSENVISHLNENKYMGVWKMCEEIFLFHSIDFSLIKIDIFPLALSLNQLNYGMNIHVSKLRGKEDV